MRVVAFGYMTWGRRTIEALLDARHEVALIVTHPDSDNAYEKIFNESVAELAADHGIPLLVRDRADDDEVRTAIADARADVMVVSNWRTWLAPEVFSLPRLGTLNVHDALLPAYAGFAPLNWALINDEPEVGVTAHMMNAEFDAGDVVLQRSTPITDDDTIVDLFDRTLAMFGPITVDALELIAQGRTSWTPQDRRAASYFHRRTEEENRIDWTWPPRDVFNLVRAQVDPYPNAYCYRGAERVRITAASLTPDAIGGTPGRIVIRRGTGVVIVAGADARRGRNPGVLVERVRTDDGRDLDATEFFTTMGGYLTSHPTSRPTC
ncbi:methionyl-tRNA formyltransferase [Pseudonocardia sp. KRD-184]|uniref:methionyl-tRNA formyltransferase n=1 Tax=Pseudonocardia oceani TaxID=2792013 RepID=UPI001C49FF17|nr:methionyl-tRNA formyltransferase [Pseudonocardia oceani]MBW0093684.1 methionyl-tRNA formyltransferase [Pseudonocardia oceani]MBW0099858.1 methionyl-tRNA formyltransferase [Pseudonocardia oceani]MBW0112505.1 methionyl-tRNA formyltransferase [Pseudonocardia oceani]MBW0125458.1 methionyl-tRNA formyltransferase [Pseudonocardia oceani]